MIIFNYFCNCKSLRKASKKLIKLYGTDLAKADLKITKFNALRNIHKLDK